MRQYYVGLDVGGTTMKAAVVDDQGKPFRSVSMPTEPLKGQDFGLAVMCETIRMAVAEAGLTMKDITALGVATPGPMDIKRGMILDPANLKPWLNVPVRQHVADHFGLPTAYQNDANAAALGEYWVGAGKQAESMVLFTLGTGIGGGIIIRDMVLEGQHSHGGELGHMKIQTKDHLRRCGCGLYGCLEAYASATSVVKRTREALASGEYNHSKLKPFENSESLSSRLIFDSELEGDVLASKIVDETAYYLAIGAANLMHIIDPDIIVFAGGMVAAGETYLKKIRKYVMQVALPFPAENTQILYAELGSDAGFIGAAACGRLLVNNGKLYA
jgi:glucokinase